jgi:4-hydroxymandelate synthase
LEGIEHTMKLIDVDHIEMFVGDAAQAAETMCRSYGFRIFGAGGPETGLEGQRSVLLGQGHIRVLLTSGLHADHPASTYVARHGDGVAVIALATDDVAAAFAETVAAGAGAVQPPHTYERDGAVVATAEVTGFGDVTHRLVQRDTAQREFLPGVIAMADGAAEQPDDLLGIIDHAAVCLPAGELEPTVRYYRDVFGFNMIFEEYIEVGAQGMFSQVVQSTSGGITLTLIEPDISRRSGQIDDFLAWHDGAGVQHIAFTAHDIVHAVRTCGERGVQFAVTPDSYYEMLPARLGEIDVPPADLAPLGILVDRDHWGLMYQIFAKSTHIRRTYFVELIDRHGAKTFGTSNIPAMKAAKERELAAIRENLRPQ